MVCKAFLFLIFLFSTSLVAEENMIYERGALHEAFLSQEYGTLLYPLITEAPPAPIEEKAAPSPDEEGEMQWIKGYWEWSETLEEFVWVSGLWRLPPPNHTWVSGKWQQMSGGWVRLPGFWSRLDQPNLQTTKELPPDAIDEYLPPAPGINYFWILGNWEFDFSSQRYDWHKGRWQLFNSSWVYMPGRFFWREEGYFFVEGYWDWPIEKRGQLYASIIVPPHQREGFIYEPMVKMDLGLVVTHYFPYWPNYLNFYHTFAYFHPEFFDVWGVHLPWWSWQEWWCYPWKEQLWLWWWWSHPGFPEPPWMTLRLSKEILPPSKGVIKMMTEAIPLPNITPHGIVGNEKFLKKLGHPYVRKKEMEEIQLELMPKEVRHPVLLPEGKEMPLSNPQKVYFGPKEEELERAPKRTSLPLLPLEKVRLEVPKIKKRQPAPFPHSNQETTPWPARFNNRLELPHSNVEGPKWPEQEEAEKRERNG